MSRDRFTASELPRPGGELLLDDAQSRHLARVRRVRPGDEAELTDGRGLVARARFLGLDGGRARLRVLSVREAGPDAPASVAVACALPKGQRAARLVRAATEAGVSEVWPFVSRRSVVRPPEGEALARLVRVAREAAKQSGRARAPEVAAVRRIEDVLALARGFDRAILAEPEGAGPMREALAGLGRGARVLLVTGPEGGFDDAERELARSRGLVAASLECPVMRVETAAAALAAVVMYACSEGQSCPRTG